MGCTTQNEKVDMVMKGIKELMNEMYYTYEKNSKKWMPPVKYRKASICSA